MNRYIALLLILVLAGGMALGQATAVEPITYDDVVAAIGSVNELLEQAIFLATAGIASRATNDQLAYAQGVLELLEGSEEGGGILEMWAVISTAMDPQDEHPAREAVLDLVDRKDQPALLSALYFTTGDFLRLASDAALLSLAEAHRGRDGREAAQNAMRSVYAFLISARGIAEDPRALPGLLKLAEFLPPMEIWVRPGESIQAAIDRVPEGGAIRLEPGVYREGLIIDKSLSLIGSNRAVIEPPMGSDGVFVESQVPIEISIRNVAFRAGSGGLELWGQVRVYAEQVDFENLAYAVQVREGAHADFVSCRFTDNASGIGFSWSASGSMRGCTVEGSEPSLGSIVLFCSDVVLTDCVIQDNTGAGVYVGGGEASKLHMTGCTLIRNEYGLSAVHGSCNPTTEEEWSPPPRYAKSHGTITGWENVIPEPWEENGNRAGAFEVYYTSLIDLRVLLAPNPEEEGS